MNRSSLLALGAALAIASSSSAEAATGVCTGPVVGTGRSSHVEGSADWNTYHGHVPASLARVRALAAWRTKVVAKCPSSSPYWWRAHDKSVLCEGTAGHDNCVVKAVPARKLLSYLKK